MTMPAVQKPHWSAWFSWNACCTGWSSFTDGARPSIVVIDPPSAWAANIVHDFTDSPSSRIVHAPHDDVSQPIFVPVRTQSSRRYCTRSVRGSTSWDCDEPFTVMETCTKFLPLWTTWPRPDAIRAESEMSPCEEVCVRRVVVDELCDEPTRGHDAPVARPHVVEGAAHELSTEPATAQMPADLGVMEDEDIAAVVVLGDAHDTSILEELVARSLGVVSDLGGHADGLPAPRRRHRHTRA